MTTTASLVHGDRCDRAEAKSRLARWSADVDARQRERDAVVVALNRAIRAYRLSSGDAYALEVTVPDVVESTVGYVRPEGAFRSEAGEALEPDRPRQRRPPRLEANQAGEAVGLALGFGDRFLEGEELLIVAAREASLGRSRSGHAALRAGAVLITEELGGDPSAGNALAAAGVTAAEGDPGAVVAAAQRLQEALEAWRLDTRSDTARR